jgi:acetoin utilization deacetylase AcuC-like enzyme
MFYLVLDSRYTEHQTGPWHPEQPFRVIAIDRALNAAGLKQSSSLLQPRLASEQDVLLCHSPLYLQLVRQEIEVLNDFNSVVSLSTGDVCISRHSFKTALLATGGVLTAIDQVFSVPGSSAFCAVRPPGHHACSSVGMGFCLFNHVAIAARYAQQKYGISRVLIADWDVHHGNGTQEIFYADPTVFYFSTHEKGLYPGTGWEDEKGKGPGLGFTLNYPIASGPLSRLEVLEAFQIHLKEEMKVFKPEFVLVSAGFDAHEKDPLGHFNLNDYDFWSLTACVKEIADTYAEGRLVSVLEGGYHLQALASAAVAHVKALQDKGFS